MIDFMSLKKSVRGLHDQLKDMANEIEGLRRQREEIEDAPLPIEDFADMIIESIDIAAAGYEEQLAKAMVSRLKSTPSHILESGQVIAGQILADGLGIGMRKHFPAPAGSIGLQALWALFGDVLKPKLRASIIAMKSYPEGGGLPRAERAPALAKLDVKIDQLESREAKLLAEAEAAGIRVAE